MRRMLIGLLVTGLALAGLILWMAGGLQGPGPIDVQTVTVDGAKVEPTDTSTLTVVTWNIAWGYGWGSEGSKGDEVKSASDIDGTIDKIGDALRALSADVVLIQEIDFGSNRSYGTDQARRIAERAGLPHVAPAVSWTANYLPFPYWPPERHWKRMSSGGAILSRYPITECGAELLEKPKSQAFWYNLFYLFRYLQWCAVDVEGTKVTVYNTHFEAFDQKNRRGHAERVVTWLKKVEGPTIFGGDLNTVPPEATIRRGFEDEDTDFSSDRTLEVIRTAGLTDVLPPEVMAKDESAYFTFPAHQPSRKLDYLFVRDLEILSAKVPGEVGALSDHLPVLVKLRKPARD